MRAGNVAVRECAHRQSKFLFRIVAGQQPVALQRILTDEGKGTP
jgi:hypothetical protein